MSLPTTWAQAPLRTLAETITKGTTPTTIGFKYLSSGIPFVKVENLSAGRIALETITGFISQEAHEKLRRSQLQSGDVLVSIAGTIGRVASVSNEDVPANTNQAVGIIRGVHQIFDPKYLRYFFESPQSQAQLQPAARGGAMNNISLADLGSVHTLIAPLSEQVRIVAEIEKQFTRLDDAVSALKRVQANLRRYRASVLKAACEGRLVPREAELARKEGRDFEPASELLKRILAERRAKWETDQLQKMIAAGKPPKDDEWKKRYKEPAPAETTNLPMIPEGWTVSSLEQLTSAIRPICYGILMPKENVADGILYVRVKDMKNDVIDVAALYRTAPKIAEEYSRASLKGGDLLLAIRGTYGRVAEVPDELEGGNITQDTARLAVSEQINRHYVAACLRSEDVQIFFKRVARGVAVKGVNIGDVRVTPILLPPRHEQDRIVSQIERGLSFVDEISSTLGATLGRSNRLRKATLNAAFSGKLVPQDPNDEPASVLLERIRAERTRAQQQKEKTPNATNGASPINGQRRRRGIKTETLSQAAGEKA